MQLVKPKYIWAFVFLLVSVAFFLFFTRTEVEGYEETQSKNSIEARWDYYDGKKEIPIELEKGKTYLITHEWTSYDVPKSKQREAGKFSIGFEDPNGKVIPYAIESKTSSRLTAKTTGTYKIVLDIVNEYGSGFSISWTKME